MSEFKDLKLNKKIVDALDKKGYKSPTPIQESSIPYLLNGKDLLGIAQTGTGKTAAFALPILNNLVESNVQVRANNIRALILTPTRELASQIADNIKFYGSGLGLTHTVLFGGVNIKNQINALKRGFDIVVATPGRFIDLKNQGHIRMSQVEIFVLDEADRMLDMGFIHDVKKVISSLPEKRQTLLFSATMPGDISKLAKSLLKDPVTVSVTPQSSTVEKIDQRVNLVEKTNKPLLLKSILAQEESKAVLIFSKTKHGANRIVDFLEKQSINAVAIHGNKSQAAREKALDAFRKSRVRVLVATDIAARGIDIPHITHVINYDVPQDPESYVHRIGRTARAGREGIAISFCDRSELELLKGVEKTIKYKIPVDDSHPYHGVKASSSPTGYSDKRPPRGADGRGPKSFNKAKPRKNSDGSSRRDEKTTSYFAQGRRHSKSAFQEDGIAGGGAARRTPRVGFKEKSGKDGRFARNESNSESTGPGVRNFSNGSSSNGGKKPPFGNRLGNKTTKPSKRPYAKKRPY